MQTEVTAAAEVAEITAEGALTLRMQDGALVAAVKMPPQETPLRAGMRFAVRARERYQVRQLQQRLVRSLYLELLEARRLPVDLELDQQQERRLQREVQSQPQDKQDQCVIVTHSQPLREALLRQGGQRADSGAVSMSPQDLKKFLNKLDHHGEFLEDNTMVFLNHKDRREGRKADKKALLNAARTPRRSQAFVRRIAPPR